MKKNNKSSDKPIQSMRPALTPEAQENQMIALAIEEAEYQMRNHTASSQVITHYLKLGSTKARLENEKLLEENKLLRAKTEALEAARNNGEKYAAALKAFQSYSGFSEVDDDEFEDY